MGIYLIRPRNSVIDFPLNQEQFLENSVERQRKIHDLTSFHQRNSTTHEIFGWTNDAYMRQLVKVIKSPASPGITGFTILSMSSKEADRMRRELPQVEIFEDILVRTPSGKAPSNPTKVKRSYKSTVSHSDLWHLEALGLRNLKAQGANLTGEGITIALLDTGVDSQHPAIKGRISSAYELDDELGFVEVPISNHVDTAGHGTAMAGLICGSQVGVSPGTKIYSFLTLPEGRGTLSGFIRALESAAMKPEVSIICCCSGGEMFLKYSDVFKNILDSVLATGCFVVSPVGNSGERNDFVQCDLNPGLFVGSVNQVGQVSDFSTSGRIHGLSKRFDIPALSC